MDNPIPRPLGLAALITATITLLSPGVMEQAGQPGRNGAIASSRNALPSSVTANSALNNALSSGAFRPSLITALQGQPKAQASFGPEPLGEGQRSLQQRPASRNQRALKPQQPRESHRSPGLYKDLPADIRSARLVLSVESLFKATTAN